MAGEGDASTTQRKETRNEWEIDQMLSRPRRGLAFGRRESDTPMVIYDLGLQNQLPADSAYSG